MSPVTRPVRPWDGAPETAAAYARLRHPALAAVRVSGPPGQIGLEVEEHPEAPTAVVVAPHASTDVLRLLGETALGLGELHALGLAHGGVTAGSIADVDGRWVLIGLAAPGDRDAQRADLHALAAVGHALAGPDPSPPVAQLLTALTGADRPAGDLGRAALALAADPTTPEPPTSSRVAKSTSNRRNEVDFPDLDVGGGGDGGRRAREASRRRTRNRMIAVGAFVVVGGALALRQVGGHGTVTVPDEHGRTRDAAVAAVTAAGLLPQVTTAASADGAPAGTVIAQVPAPGTGVRPGRTVVLTLAPSATAAPR